LGSSTEIDWAGRTGASESTSASWALPDRSTRPELQRGTHPVTPRQSLRRPPGVAPAGASRRLPRSSRRYPVHVIHVRPAPITFFTWTAEEYDKQSKLKLSRHEIVLNRAFPAGGTRISVGLAGGPGGAGPRPPRHRHGRGRPAADRQLLRMIFNHLVLTI
jgi:hypothetical protein